MTRSEQDRSAGLTPQKKVLPFRVAKRVFEKQYVVRVLQMARGEVVEAAKLSGKERKDFYDLMTRVGVYPENFRDPGAKVGGRKRTRP